jgi:hypothetical protein
LTDTGRRGDGDRFSVRDRVRNEKVRRLEDEKVSEKENEKLREGKVKR